MNARAYPVAAASWRSLRPGRLALDLLTLAVVCALVSFLVMFVSRQAVDLALFEAGLDYDERAAAPAGRGDLDVFEGAELAVPRTSDGPLLTDAVTVTVWRSAGMGDDELVGRLGASLVDGAPAADGALVDVGTAYRLGVDDETAVLLSLADDGTAAPRCTLAVTGYVRSYHDPQRPGDGGLVVLPEGACRGTMPPASADWALAFDPAADGTSKAGNVVGTLLDSPMAGAATTTIILLALGLWALAIRRVTDRLVREVWHTRRTLWGEGVSLRMIDAVHAAGFAVVLLVVAGAATWAARALVAAVAGFYVQPLHAATVLVLVALVAAFAAAHRARRLNADLRRITDE